MVIGVQMFCRLASARTVNVPEDGFAQRKSFACRDRSKLTMEYFETTLEPYSRMQDLYQSYYRASISQFCEQQSIGFLQNTPKLTDILRVLGRVRESDRFHRLGAARVGNRMLDGVAAVLGARGVTPHVVGRYVYHRPGSDIRICIDAEDSGAIEQPDLLEWSDVYFKTNYWPDRPYSSKVLPLANVNPLVLTRQEELRAFRASEPEWDVFGFFRVWGRIDHNLALFEALAQLKRRTKLIAYLISADYKGEAARLEKAGVAWTRRPMPLRKLWSFAARSRLNIIRHGVADCIPWRMTDIMAMGHCPVLDYDAKTRWHLPLVENAHYLSLGMPPEENLAPKEYACRAVERIEGWLSRRDLIAEIGENCAAYFDENLAPAKLGRYLVERSRAT